MLNLNQEEIIITFKNPQIDICSSFKIFKNIIIIGYDCFAHMYLVPVEDIKRVLDLPETVGIDSCVYNHVCAGNRN